MKKCILNVMKVVLAVALALNCCLPIAHASTYHDVFDDDWYAEAIEYVTRHELMNGVGNGNFQPHQPLTRAQVVTLLYRLAGTPETEYEEQFQDVPKDEWYAAPVSWAYQQDVVHGTSKITFSPLTNITREQLATILFNYIKSIGAELPEAKSALDSLKDCWFVSPYAEESVWTMCHAAIMNPDAQYNFNPKGNVTRADAAVVFMRLSKALAGEQLTGTVIPNTAIDFSKLSLSQNEKDAQALAIAKQIAAIIPDNISDVQRIQMAAHIVSHYSKFCTYTMSGPDYWSAYGVFVKGEYSCAGSTRALGLVLTCMGYQWWHMNENQYTHQWCEVNMDGRRGYADGQTGLVGYGAEPSIAGEVNNPFVGSFDPWQSTLQWLSTKGALQ